jgi:hypothetical protein
MLLKHPVIQVCKSGLILCAPSGFGSNGTSIPDILPIKREGPWSTHSIAHDAGYCLGVGWRIDYHNLHKVRLEREDVDGAWVEGHTCKRYTDKAGDLETRYHKAGIYIGGARSWMHYRENEKSLRHAGEVYNLTVRAEAEVWDFLTLGVKSLEDGQGFAVV